MKLLTYTEFLLSIEVQINNGNIAFNTVNGFKSKDYPDGNAAMTWGKF